MGVQMYWVSFSKTDTRESNMWEWDSRYSGFYLPKRKPRIPHVVVQSKKLTPSCTGSIFQNGEPKNFIHWGPAVLGFIFQNGQKKISVGQAVDFIFTRMEHEDNHQGGTLFSSEEIHESRSKSFCQTELFQKSSTPFCTWH